MTLAAGESAAANDREATRLARAQRAHMKRPTPYPPKERDDIVVPLENPAIELPIYWLGPRSTPAAAPIRCRSPPPTGRCSKARPLPGPSSNSGTTTGPFSSGLGRPKARQLYRHEKLGHELLDWKCTKTTQLPVTGGSATLYAGYDKNFSAAPDVFAAVVEVGGVVLGMGLPTCYTASAAGHTAPRWKPPSAPCASSTRRSRRGGLDAMEGHGPRGNTRLGRRCPPSTPPFRSRKISRLVRHEPPDQTRHRRRGTEFEPSLAHSGTGAIQCPNPRISACISPHIRPYSGPSRVLRRCLYSCKYAISRLVLFWSERLIAPRRSAVRIRLAPLFFLQIGGFRLVSRWFRSQRSGTQCPKSSNWPPSGPKFSAPSERRPSHLQDFLELS